MGRANINSRKVNGCARNRVKMAQQIFTVVINTINHQSSGQRVRLCCCNRHSPVCDLKYKVIYFYLMCQFKVSISSGLICLLHTVTQESRILPSCSPSILQGIAQIFMVKPCQSMSVIQLIRRGKGSKGQRSKTQGCKWHTSLSLIFQQQKFNHLATPRGSIQNF